MKIRKGFVSNSSSTAFIFITKNDRFHSLIKQIRHHDAFNLYYVGYYDNKKYKVSNEEVIDAIEEAKVKYRKNKNYSIEPTSIDKVIEEIRTHITELEKNTDWDWIKEYIYKRKNTIRKLKEYKKLGFKYVYEIGFGDNDGHICGGKVGTAMDYEGRDICIKGKDLIVYTEQRR